MINLKIIILGFRVSKGLWHGIRNDLIVASPLQSENVHVDDVMITTIFCDEVIRVGLKTDNYNSLVVFIHNQCDVQ